MTVQTRVTGRTLVVTIDRPEARNAVDGPTAAAWPRRSAPSTATPSSTWPCSPARAAHSAPAPTSRPWVLSREPGRADDGDGPMGPTRMLLTKPVIAAVEGFAVAGGLELALWCDLRVARDDAVFGVYCRRWGVPLIDGGTIRLPRLIGQSHALDLILTGRGVVRRRGASGWAWRTGRADPGRRSRGALTLAAELRVFPQRCLRGDRASVRAVGPVPGRRAGQRDPPRPRGDRHAARPRPGPPGSPPAPAATARSE